MLDKWERIQIKMSRLRYTNITRTYNHNTDTNRRNFCY